MVRRVSELALGDETLSGYIISKTNETVGRECTDVEELTDHQWWHAHGLVLSGILLEAYRDLDAINRLPTVIGEMVLKL